MQLRGVAENLMTTLTERMRRANEKALALQRERLELNHLRKELEVARQLQASMLPLQRPLFPGRSDIEVCGFMEPASKVGGDLFDAFFVDRPHAVRLHRRRFGPRHRGRAVHGPGDRAAADAGHGDDAAREDARDAQRPAVHRQ